MRMEFNTLRMMRVYLEDTDKCKTCANTGSCPLIFMLKDNLAALKYPSVRVDRCKMHKKRGVNNG